MTAVATPPPARHRRRMTPGPEAAEARSTRSRHGQQTRRLARAIAGDRAAGVEWALNELTITGDLRRACERIFAAGRHLDPLVHAGAVVHAADLELQAAAHRAAIEEARTAGAEVREWRVKAHAYVSKSAFQALERLGLTPRQQRGGQAARGLRDLLPPRAGGQR